MMRAIRTVAVVAATAGLSVMGMTAAQAGPVQPHCGDTITSSVRLTHDLVCAGNGLVIGADGVTVDLNGHTLRGNGTGIGILAGGYAGSSPAVDEVRVMNGTISHFADGFYAFKLHSLGGSYLLALRNVRLTSNGDGVYAYAYGADAGISIDRSRLSNNNAGVTAIGPNVAVVHSIVSGNGVGLDAVTDTHLRFDRSTLSGNGLGAGTVESWLDMSYSTVSGNRNGVLLGVASWGSHIDHTDFRDQRSGFGLRVERKAWGSGATFIGNTFLRNRVGLSGDTLSAPGGSAVRGNVFRDNGAAGVYLDDRGGPSGDPGIRVDRNLFEHNGFASAGTVDSAGHPVNDGLHVNGIATVSNNLAQHNADYGIEAYRAIDGGGNVARHNGNPAQCVGVSCTGV